MQNLAQGPPLGDDPDILVSYSDRDNRAGAANQAKVSQKVEAPSSRRNMTNESGFLGHSKQIDTLKNS
jgi:hypothetical protein